SLYRPSGREYPEALPELEFGPDDIVRRVRHDGMIAFAKRLWYLSEALTGQRVGLRPTTVDGVLDVCLGPHPVGRIDQRNNTRQAVRRRQRPADDADTLDQANV